MRHHRPFVVGGLLALSSISCRGVLGVEPGTLQEEAGTHGDASVLRDGPLPEATIRHPDAAYSDVVVAPDDVTEVPSDAADAGVGGDGGEPLPDGSVVPD